MVKKLPSIFEYINFRQYLKDYRDKRKEFDPGFTNQYICHYLGQKSSKSYFNNIVSGRKPLTPSFIDKIVELLQFDADQSRYFRALVNYNQTLSPKEKEYHFNQVVSLNRTPKKFISEDTFSYFSEWYHASMRELLDIYDFTGNYKEVALRLDPPISAKEAQESIRLLKKLKLVKKNKNGILKSTDKVLTTGNNVQNALLEQYQSQALKRAREKIAASPNKHKTVVMTLSLSTLGLTRILNRMEQFKSEMRSIAHKDEEGMKKVYEFIVHGHTLSN